MPHIDMLSFWGKARPRDAGVDVPWHPVAYHLLDVAAVTGALFDARPMALETAARLLCQPPDDARRLLVALAAMHDLGKFAPAFQAKAPDCWPTSVLGPYDERWNAPGQHHTEDGLVLWNARLLPNVVERLWPAGEAALRALAPAIFGHHGRPVGGAMRHGTLAARFRRDEAVGAATGCAELVLDLLAQEPITADAPSRSAARCASWWISGLLTVADWIGSSERWFQPYVAPMSDDPALVRYWSLAQERAVVAVSEAGLLTPTSARAKTFAQLTGISLRASPAQQWAETISLPSGPVLIILEDVTGAGKTEAAQMLVHRVMAADRALGAYWAMPTQATANAMYARQARAIEGLFDDPVRVPSLALAHGQQRLNERFRANVLEGAARDPCEGERDPASRGEGEELPSGVACSSWLADDRRAAMLADVGAGTIDQVLLAVLPSRFNTMRLLGLGNKVLVIDEAHAYDAYMGEEVDELLRFHAMLGGSAIVLTATLPRRRRAALAAAWDDGVRGGQRRLGVEVPLASSAYPLATIVCEEGVRECSLEAAPWSERTVMVRFVSELDSALEHVVRAARAGGAVAWIRNTVDDCLAAADLLRDHGVEPLVFHARFAQGDRQRREAEVMKRFGKEFLTARRAQVVVASQVIEQSLDLDFDAMVTDVAPVDLLVQRAGRLWRHQSRQSDRPTDMKCELVVLAPPPNDDPPEDWLAGIFAGTAHVYENPGVLWRTVRALSRAGAIVTPEGLRDLIESVYGSEEVPASLLPVAQRSEGKERGNAATAAISTLKAPQGYDATQHAWLSDLRVPTRLGDEQTVVRLARVAANGMLMPWAEDERPPWKAWALSEVRLSARKVPFEATAEPRFESAIAAARATWGRFDQEISVLPLERVDDGVWRGVLLRTDGKPIAVRYTEAEGLAYEKSAPVAQAPRPAAERLSDLRANLP
jgi:CRISPR-associated endonuclease/helicase Cas3